MKKSKQAFIHSVIALLLCVSMFVGTTFAWFTDEVTSMNNIIQSGTLDIDLEYMDAQGNWHSVNQNTNVFDEDALWEPGHTEVVYLRVINKGNLALKYQLGVNVASETPGTNVAGDQFKLSDYIKMGAVEGVTTAYGTREEARKAVTTSGTLASGYVTYGRMLANDPEQYIALVVYMPEEVDNVANYRGDAVPTIHLGINLMATQLTSENDSFGPDYDEGAKHPLGNINFTSTQSVADKVENGLLTEAVTVGDANGEIYAEVPDGVKLADGADSLELIVQAMQNSQADIQLEVGESKQAFNIHMDGVAEDNTVPMLITIEKMFKPDLNSTSVAMYHVENGQTVAMTSVALADLDAHNEFYYNVYNGNVILCVATFSEYVAVTNDKNPWEGKANIDWYKDADTVFTLNTAEEFAGFGLLVDGGNTFDGKTIKLGADINLEGFDAEGNRYSFNPIGCGYEDSTINSNGVEGRVFKGIFDGQGHEITGLYQNGWEIGLSYCNLGGGLFASVKDATIQNLTISGAEIVMECVEQGVVAGLVQGFCTFDNINIYGCSVANYQKATGGLIGEVSGTGTTTITNVTIDSTTVVGSLWGDFDAPVGGVIGARWNNEGTDPAINMNNVKVACRLDVYNDVTSSYQWYAYRRAGMLIGNTEEADGHTATADFLTCSNVVVCYGDWVNYHYCEFNNHNSSWPFVRVEAGENCEAFSNPRWGVPNGVNGVKVTPENHTAVGDAGIHQEGDDCMVLLEFNQLYGGGQGVYGKETHDGVSIQDYYYKVEYINNSETLYEEYLTSADEYIVLTKNDAKFNDIQGVVQSQMGDNTYIIGYWMNAGSTKVTSIPAGNLEDIKLYPSFEDRYTATFVDLDGNVLGWDTFTRNSYSNVENKSKTVSAPAVEDCEFDHWRVHVVKDGKATDTDLSTYKFADGVDVTIYPVYKYNGDVSLIPVDSDGDGATNYYQVGGYGASTGQQELVEIPGFVNGIPVTTINADAFSSYDDLHSVRIPATIKSIDYQAFSADTPDTWNPSTWGDQRDTITMYYDGDPAVWKAAMNDYNNRIFNDDSLLKSGWDNMMGEGSCVFFLDNNGKVITTEYWELAKVNSKYVWQYHNHAYRSNGNCGNEHNNTTIYTNNCECDLGPHPRDDAKYWTPVTTTGDEE